MTYNLFGTNDLHIFSDVNWGSSITNEHKSISGGVVTLSDATISWKSKKKTLLELLTTEIECAAMSVAMREIVKIVQLLGEIGVPQLQPKNLYYCNNQVASVLSCDSI